MMIDTFETATDKLIFQVRKTAKTDGSHLTKVFNYDKQKGMTVAQQVLGDGKAKMQTVFFHNPNQTLKSSGDFFHVENKQLSKKGKITYIPITKQIMAQSEAISGRVSIFNKLFGKIN